jgi:hypothetical protein
MGNKVEATFQSGSTLSLNDRLYLRRKYQLNRLAMASLERMGVALADAVLFIEQRLTRGLPAHPVWTTGLGTRVAGG